MEVQERQPDSWTCVVCGGTHESWYAWNVVGLKKVCPNCREWHKWCKSCARARLHSEFSPSSSAADGMQHRCIECCGRNAGIFRIKACVGCQGEFVVSPSARYNGKAEWLCDDCGAGKKHCKRCGLVKLLDEFSAARDKRSGRVAYCRPCASAAHAEKTPAQRRNPKLKRAYNLTHDEFEAMLAAQGGGCKICGTTDPGRTAAGTPKHFSVDHDHKTGRVRGILCPGCNMALGLMQDNVDRLRAAVEYLTARL